MIANASFHLAQTPATMLQMANRFQLIYCMFPACSVKIFIVAKPLLKTSKLAKIATISQRGLSPVARREATKMKKGSRQFLKSLRSSKNWTRKGKGRVDLIRKSSR